jgi:hypothetical protein
MKFTSLLLLAALLAAGSLQAQTQAPTPGGGGRMSPEEHARAKACEKEMQHLCAGKQGQAAKECLQANEGKLSSQCKGQLKSGT